MTFPFSRSTVIKIDPHYQAENVLSDIERRLPHLGARNLRRTPGALSFSVLWITTNGPLFLVSRGEFGMAQSTDTERTQYLRCYLSFHKFAVMFIILIYGWFGLGASFFEGDFSGRSLGIKFVLCTVGWCWVLGMWYLIVPHWLVRRLNLERYAQVSESAA